MVKEYTPAIPIPVEKGLDPKDLVEGRYGTKAMIDIFGPERTFEYILLTEGVAANLMNRLHPDVLPVAYAEEISKKARLGIVDPNRIRALEEQTGHDITGVNMALEEVLSEGAKPYVGIAKTSADKTETAKALQIKRAIEVIANSVENLRDIVLEKALEYKDLPFIDMTHLLDALPSVAGRAFAFYGEMLQSDLRVLNYVYGNSIVGKWSDATGCHHSATALGINGIELEEEFCSELGILHMDAAAQIPGREFLSDPVYAMARTAGTMANLERYMRNMKGSDPHVFIDTNPKKRKGSSAMPQKDIGGGNPIVEEQTGSFFNYALGSLTTSLSSVRFDYGRDLEGSASDRIVFSQLFKWGDFVVRRMAQTVHFLKVDRERSLDRLNRSYGVVTSEWVLNYLIDKRRTSSPMPRKDAHNLVAELATKAYTTKTQFADILLQNPEIRDRFDEETIRKISNPEKFIGQAKENIDLVFDLYHESKTLVL